MGLDFIFEFFAYSQLVVCLKKLGFELVEASDGFPLPTYLSFLNTQKRFGIRFSMTALCQKRMRKSQISYLGLWQNNINGPTSFFIFTRRLR